LDTILAGSWDTYIDQWAEGAKRFGKPLLVAWGLEMNGNWFPWCGIFAGGAERLPGEGEPRYRGPETFKKAYRYIVDRVRKVGAKNVQWVFHVNNTPDPWEPWNSMANYYPGSEYVDWLGMSAYGKQYPGPGWTNFSDVLPKPYEELMKLDPDKPFILAEWGIGEFPKEGNKAAYIEEAMRRMETEFPRLKAAVFWHERWQNGDLSYSNLRVNSSLEALEAYKKGVRSSFWLDRPLFDRR
jgi:beta-mannanase